ncbi:microcystin degradation protein MlrC [Pradoshia eiseniae]|uniref:Microcystin degradation protein MlrC n=1 Tax=Pradoshia eiseniae TaxID=2064768 RepID=A0A2S7N5D3_9BACI|nr:M81 family metallopeptidase [Pradoshia eiseniae]PQD97185.1 microcystin degradation protein MlrC [Pradoshia eiseniae]
MKQWRIGVAFFYHESHSFVREKTTIEDFKREGFFKGQEIVDVYTGTKTEVGGFLDELALDERFSVVPLQCAAAIPSGVVTFETYEEIEAGLLKELKTAGQLDGLLLALHGAMVVEGLENAEMSLINAIREEIGESIPFATTLDMHANISPLLTECSPYHFGFKTYPHIDMYEQGRRAASAIMKHLGQRKLYEAACIKLPMLLPSVNMRTEEGPMKRMMVMAEQYEREPDILAVSVFGGFPYGDVKDAGASVLVIAKDKERAQTVASSIGEYYWGIRQEFLVNLPSINEAIDMISELEEEKPIVLADIADNPLSCGSGDTTLLIEAFLNTDLKKALIGPIADRETFEQCRKAGKGARLKLSLGGKHYPEFGRPVGLEAEVLAITDGIFYNSGPFNHGLKVDAQGAAFIRSGERDFLIIGRPLSANDPALFRHIGIEPSDYRFLVLKAKNHFRAAFDPLISKVIYVDAPGVATNKIVQLPFQKIPPGLWPINQEIQ